MGAVQDGLDSVQPSIALDNRETSLMGVLMNLPRGNTLIDYNRDADLDPGFKEAPDISTHAKIVMKN